MAPSGPPNESVRFVSYDTDFESYDTGFVSADTDFVSYDTRSHELPAIPLSFVIFIKVDDTPEIVYFGLRTPLVSPLSFSQLNSFT